MADAAVVFDVDGVLLHLTRDEEEVFFTALSKFVPTENLSRDWNSYRIRNDEDIIAEVLARNLLPTSLIEDAKAHYISLLKSSAIQSSVIAGAAPLLASLQGKADLGIATANLLGAAQHRLQQVELWPLVSACAYGADGGGHKSAILGRALLHLNRRPSRVVYVGDNLNDVAAGLSHGVNFIGFSEHLERREQLRAAGAIHLSANHKETCVLINQLLA